MQQISHRIPIWSRRQAALAEQARRQAEFQPRLEAFQQGQWVTVKLLEVVLEPMPLCRLYLQCCGGKMVTGFGPQLRVVYGPHPAGSDSRHTDEPSYLARADFGRIIRIGQRPVTGVTVTDTQHRMNKWTLTVDEFNRQSAAASDGTL